MTHSYVYRNPYKGNAINTGYDIFNMDVQIQCVMLEWVPTA